jgi:hypothetical protein
MNRLGLLRAGALDLLSAAAFLAIWLLRDHFEYDTLRALLLWPVVFEMYLAIALFLAGSASAVGSDTARWIWCLLMIGAYLFAAWLTGASSAMPQIWTIAFWLLVARVWPPRSFTLGSRLYLESLQRSAGMSGLLWGAAFVAMMLLVLVVPGHAEVQVDGSLRSTSPAWIFPLVWTPYFIAEAMLRAWRETRKAASQGANTAGKR